MRNSFWEFMDKRERDDKRRFQWVEPLTDEDFKVYIKDWCNENGVIFVREEQVV